MRSASRVLLWGATALVLLLAWLALDDITTGSQPSFRLEWTMVALAVVWLAARAIAALVRRRSG